jgi:hypothetical protein
MKGQRMTRGHRKSITRSVRKQRQTWGGTYSVRGMCSDPKALAHALKSKAVGTKGEVRRGFIELLAAAMGVRRNKA